MYGIFHTRNVYKHLRFYLQVLLKLITLNHYIYGFNVILLKNLKWYCKTEIQD